MSNFFYLFRFPAGDNRFYRLPSNHKFPSPVKTCFHIWYGEHEAGQRGDKLFVVTVTDFYDDLQNGNFYMMLADDGGDPWNNENDDWKDIVKALVEQGWETGFKLDY